MQDLIIATRHILQSDLRTAFLSQIDTLLDEHVLTGNSVTGHENLRPLAFSMLADLIHHCRADLTLSQLSRVVHVYCANVHDPTLASAIQTMCSKLLLNLIDPIAGKEPQEAVKILQRILLAFVSRMEAMAEVRDEWTKWSKGREQLATAVEKVRKREQERKAWQEKEKKKGEEKEKKKGEDEGMEGVEVEVEKEGAADKAEEKEKESSSDEKMDVDGSEEKEKAAGEDAEKKEGGEEDGEKKPKKEDEDVEPALLELDDVDIERAKPVKKAIVMVDPGPDPVKGALSSSPSPSLLC